MAKDKSNDEQMLIDREKAIEEKLKAKEEAIVAKQKAKEEAAMAKLQAKEEAINAKLKAKEEKLKAKDEAKAAKLKAKEELLKAKTEQKAKAAEEKEKARLESEKAHAELEKAKEEARAEKEKMKEELAKAKQSASDDKLKAKEEAAKAKEAAAKEKEAAANEKLKAKETAAKEKAKAEKPTKEAKAKKEVDPKAEKEKAKQAALKEKLKAKAEKEKAKEEIAKAKAKAKEEAEKEKQKLIAEKLAAKEKARSEKEKANAKVDLEKAKTKVSASAQKSTVKKGVEAEKTKADIAAEKAKAKEEIKLAKQKAKEEAEKAKQRAKEADAKEKAKEAAANEKMKAKEAAAKEKEKAKAAKLAEKEKAKQEAAKLKEKAAEAKSKPVKEAKPAKVKEDAEAKVKQEAKEAKKEQKAKEKAKAEQEKTREINLEKERMEREKAAQKRQQDKEKAAALIAKKKLQEQKAKEKAAANAEKEEYKTHKKEIKYAEMKGLRFNAKTPAKQKANDPTQIIEIINERKAQKPKVNAGKYSVVNSNEKEFLAAPEGTNILSKLRNVDVNNGRGANEVKIIDDISLNIINGETIGVIGDVQSGKSTFAKVLEGKTTRSNGSVLIKDAYTSMKPSQINPKEKKELEENVQVVYDEPIMSLKPYKRISEFLTEKIASMNDLKRIYIKAFDIITATTLAKLLEGKEQPKVVERITLKWLLEQIAEERFESIDRKLYYDAIESLYNHEKPFALTAADYLSMRRSVRKDIKESTEPKHKLLERMAMETLQIVGLSETYLNRYSVELSNLEQEQIALAYYLLLRPAILVTDNSLSSIKDDNDRKAFVKTVQEMKRKYDLTLVLIENDIKIQKTLANRVVVMHKGRIVEVAETSELIKNPIHPITKMIIKPKTEAKAREMLANVAEGEKLWYKVFETKKPVENHFVFGELESITKWAGGK